MSYRNPTIVQNQSGLLVPQALAKAAENISQTWSKQLSDQRKLNLARREEDRKKRSFSRTSNSRCQGKL